jgi:AcrR family transcriptional regulator
VPRRSREATAETRRQIVEKAVDVASTDGLEGLTIGRLAGDVGMSKSGLLNHFGTKESLQMAALDAAMERFTDEVWRPVAAERPGLPRLRAAAEAWISYLERRVFPGGCFFASATMEVDDRPGPVRDKLSRNMTRWLELLAADAHEAQRVGDLPPEPTPEQLAFELQGLILGTNWAYQLLRDEGAFPRAREALDRLIPPPPG